MLAILAPQWQGGNTSPCHCEAGIPSLGAPPVKITPNRVKYSKLHSRWCNFPSSDASCPPQGTTLLPAPTRLPPPSQDPSRHALCLRSLGWGVFRASASARSHKNSTIFRIVARRSIPNHGNHFPSLSSARFDGDVGYVVTDEYLLRRRVATRGRGCRPQRVHIQQNKSMRGCNALASTASPNAPITLPLALGIAMTMAGGGLGLGFGGNSSRRQPPAAAAAERWRRVRWERKGGHRQQPTNGGDQRCC